MAHDVLFAFGEVEVSSRENFLLIANVAIEILWIFLSYGIGVTYVDLSST